MKTNMPYDVTGPNPAEAAALAGDQAVLNTPYQTTDDAQATDSEPAAGNAPAEMPDIVNDDMSFGQAFAAARQAMGPGASFTWHGRVYGTYYENEWNALTPREQHSFTQAALGNTPVETPIEVTVEEPVYADNGHNPIDIIDDDDTEVRILGMTSSDNADGHINLATLDVDGQQVYMVDLDNDNVFDLAIADFDNSGAIFDSANDIMPVDSLNIGVDDVARALDAQNMATDTDMADIDMAADTDSMTDIDII